jgi:putative addiction module component (TIGR02574 family)
MIGAALHRGAVAGKLLSMARRIEQIHEDIRGLSTSEKESLLRSLWEELDGAADPDVDAAWLEEAQRRDREIEVGDVHAVPAEEVFKRLEASLKK